MYILYFSIGFLLIVTILLYYIYTTNKMLQEQSTRTEANVIYYDNSLYPYYWYGFPRYYGGYYGGGHYWNGGRHHGGRHHGTHH